MNKRDLSRDLLMVDAARERQQRCDATQLEQHLLPYICEGTVQLGVAALDGWREAILRAQKAEADLDAIRSIVSGKE